MLKFSGKVIATFLAHPDDETLGCGGLIARAREEGAEVHCIIPVKRIVDEFGNAMVQLGHATPHWGNFEDNSMDGYPLLDVCKFLEYKLDTIKPDILITHHYRCMNQDHRVCFEAASIAIRPISCKRGKIQLLSCEIPSSTGYLRPTDFEPNLYVALTPEQITKKVNAVHTYRTQMRSDRSLSLIDALARVRGAESGNEYAEGYMVVRSYA